MVDFVIQTRQKNDVLFPIPPIPAAVPLTVGVFIPTPVPNPSAVPSSVSPLAGSISQGFGPVEIDGYGAIIVLLISDQPFTVTFFESILSSGPFFLSQTFISSASGALFVVFNLLRAN